MATEPLEPTEAAEATSKPATKRPTTREGRRRARCGPRRTTVTKVEREVWDLRNQGVSWAQMARDLGKDSRTLQRAHDRAKRKIPLEGKLEAHPKSLQKKNPEKYAEFAAELASPDVGSLKMSVQAIAKRLSIPDSTANDIATELRSIYFPTQVEARNVGLERLQELCGTRAEQALAAMTPDKFAKANVRDLAIVAGINIEKVLLLRGQPTQIVKTEEDRIKLGELVQALLTEVDRRGKTVLTDESTGIIDVPYVDANDPRQIEENLDA